MKSPAFLSWNEDDRRYAYAVARRIVRDEQDAHDVAQDALLLAFRYRDSFRGQSKPRTWLHRIVVTTALTHIRSAARRRRGLDKLGEQPVPPNATPEQALQTRELARLIDDRVATLGTKYREILQLRGQDLTDAEISDRLAISVGSVKVRSHRARQQLRELLTGPAGDQLAA